MTKRFDVKEFALFVDPFELIKWVLLSGPIAERPKPYASVEALLRAYVDRHGGYTVTNFYFDENDDYSITIKTACDKELDGRLPDWLQNLGNGETARFAFPFGEGEAPHPSYCESVVEPAKFVVEVLEQWQKVKRWE